uniref:Uncharacterized protein n=1 Tax=Bos indicus x Bos taurus TaxID=30522 RepID=A0A4W2HUC3_BOBOX
KKCPQLSTDRTQSSAERWVTGISERKTHRPRRTQGKPRIWVEPVPGLLETGDALLCPENLDADEVEELENQALLPDLRQKYLTVLAKPHWLLQPVPGRGGKDIFQSDPKGRFY